MSTSDFDHTKLDDVVHSRLRLGVMAYLSTAATASFVDLRAKVNATDGNLSKQLSKLEEAGYVRIEKTFNGKKPQTLVHLTPRGREAWIGYLAQLEAFITASRNDGSPSLVVQPSPMDVPPGECGTVQRR